MYVSAMHSVSSQLLVSMLIIAVPTNTENFKFVFFFYNEWVTAQSFQTLANLICQKALIVSEATKI